MGLGLGSGRVGTSGVPEVRVWSRLSVQNNGDEIPFDSESFHLRTSPSGSTLDLTLDPEWTD